MGLDERICQALDQMGFVQPTEIQEKAIPAFLASEQDIIAQIGRASCRERV